MRTVYIDTKKELNKRRLKKIAKKLYKMNKKEEIVVALSKNLEKNEELNEEISSYGLNILNGRWLFKFLLIQILEYLSKESNKNIEKLTVAVLMEKLDEIILKQLIEIAKKIKVLKIITKDINRYSYIEKELYQKEGIAIQITNNKAKSLVNVDIIINLDLNKAKLEEYNIDKCATLINIKQMVNFNPNEFEGININNYEISYSEENFKNEDIKNEFDPNILYESYIYRKDTYANIKKQLEIDNVRLTKLA